MKVEIDPVKLAIHISGIKKERLTEDEDDDEGAVENNPETWEEDDMGNFVRATTTLGACTPITSAEMQLVTTTRFSLWTQAVVLMTWRWWRLDIRTTSTRWCRSQGSYV